MNDFVYYFGNVIIALFLLRNLFRGNKSTRLVWNYITTVVLDSKQGKVTDKPTWGFESNFRNHLKRKKTTTDSSHENIVIKDQVLMTKTEPAQFLVEAPEVEIDDSAIYQALPA